MVGVGNAGASGGTWTYNGNGSWATGSDWSGGLFPSSGTVTLGSPGGPITVTLDGYRTAGALVFNGANGYTLSQGTGGALTLGTTAGGSIAVNNGSHTISAPVQMAGNLTVGVASGTSLLLSGALSESATGTSFTFNGPGTLNYSAVGTFTGNTTVNGGTLNLTGGYLPGGPGEYVNSTVVQTNGSNVVSPAGYYNALYVNSGATYTLSGGQLSTPAEWVSYYASAAFVQTGGTNSAANFLNIGAYANATYTLSGGLLSVGTEELGAMGTPNSSTITQSGGTNLATTLELGYGSPASYYLTGGTSGGGGTLSAVTEYLGAYRGSGYFSQSAGTNSASFLYAGYSNGAGEYILSGSGLLSAAYEYFGYNSLYTSTMYQSGGTNSVSSGQSASALYLGFNAGDNGTYNLSGSGLLSVGFEEYIGDNGTGSFTQSGGTHTVSSFMILGNNAGGSGSYLLNSGLLYVGVGGNANEDIGNSGSGSFTQMDGNHMVSGVLLLGNAAGATGTYDLQGGSLSATDEFVGVSGSGSFMQSGGTNTVGIMFLGLNGGSGTYNLSGNGQLSAYFGYEYIGASPVTGAYSGTGSFLQTGGTNSAGNLTLALGSGYSGTYTLNGGLLQLSSLAQGGGAATFNFGGGVFQATASIYTSVPIVLTAAVGNGVFDTNGNALTLAGPLSGPGGLQKIGAGTLTLAVSNGYTGTTLVSIGTLLLGDSNALSGSTFDSSGSGTLSFGALVSAVFGGLQGSGSLALTDASLVDVALTVGGNNADTTFSGNLSDGSGLGSLTKTGTGTLVLSGSNTYGSGTTVLYGTLILTNNEALADGSSLTVGDPSMFIPPDGGVGDALPATVPVPEPGTLALLMAAAGLIAIHRKRRRRANRDRTGFGC